MKRNDVDYLKINKLSAQAGVATTNKAKEFLEKNQDVRLRHNHSYLSYKAKPFYPGQLTFEDKGTPSGTYGRPARPSTPIKGVLEHENMHEEKKAAKRKFNNTYNSLTVPIKKAKMTKAHLLSREEAKKRVDAVETRFSPQRGGAWRMR